jgi:hypothetical protein
MAEPLNFLSLLTGSFGRCGTGRALTRGQIYLELGKHSRRGGRSCCRPKARSSCGPRGPVDRP